MPDTFTKRAYELLAFSSEWTPGYLGPPGEERVVVSGPIGASDRIVGSTWTIPPALKMGRSIITGTHRATAWIGGGTPGETYTVSNTVTTDSGPFTQTFEIVVALEPDPVFLDPETTFPGNSLATLPEAAAYFRDHIRGASWFSLSDGEQAKALIAATRRMGVLRFGGQPVSPGQPLPWPRTGAFDVDRRPIPPDVIPTAITSGVCEWALNLAHGDPLAELARRVRRERIGESEVEFWTQNPDPLPPLVRALLAPFLRSPGVTAEMVP